MEKLTVSDETLNTTDTDMSTSEIFLFSEEEITSKNFDLSLLLKQSKSSTNSFEIAFKFNENANLNNCFERLVKSKDLLLELLSEKCLFLSCFKTEAEKCEKTNSIILRFTLDEEKREIFSNYQKIKENISLNEKTNISINLSLKNGFNSFDSKNIDIVELFDKYNFRLQSELPTNFEKILSSVFDGPELLKFIISKIVSANDLKLRANIEFSNIFSTSQINKINAFLNGASKALNSIVNGLLGSDSPLLDLSGISVTGELFNIYIHANLFAPSLIKKN